MKFFAAPVPRSVRTTRLGHLRNDAIIGCLSIAVPGGSYQTFDIVMQGEADFLRTKNQLATPVTSPFQQQAGMNTAYVLKDTRQFDVPEGTENAREIAAAHFLAEFKVPSP